MQEISKECYVLIERLSQHLIKKPLLKVDKQYEISSKETLKFNDDLSDNI